VARRTTGTAPPASTTSPGVASTAATTAAHQRKGDGADAADRRRAPYPSCSSPRFADFARAGGIAVSDVVSRRPPWRCVVVARPGSSK
jgi:hypothetical protein